MSERYSGSETKFSTGVRRALPNLYFATLALIGSGCSIAPTNPNMTPTPTIGNVQQQICPPLSPNKEYLCPSGALVDVTQNSDGSLNITALSQAGTNSIHIPYSSNPRRGGLGIMNYCSAFVDTQNGQVIDVFESCEFPPTVTPTH